MLVIRAPRPPVLAPPPITVLYEDSEVIAVDKPPGVNVAMEREGLEGDSLQRRASAWLERRGQGSGLVGPRARLIHRLDRDTSGVVLFGKTPRAQSSLGRDWEAGTVEKSYLALARGVPEAQPESWYVIDRPLGRDRERKNRQAVEGLDAVPARSRWRMIEALGAFSLLEVQPLTGRTHQIRVHLASIGFPLAIDPLYAEPGLPPPPAITRLTLHARSITFKDARGKPVTVESPIPADFAAAVDRLRAAK